MIILAFILFLFGLSVGWFLCHRYRPQESGSRKTNLRRDYLIGLNFLLNEETDKAVDVFIKMLEVDSDTVETHLAVGKLFRKRGEVDRAIRIHQNLIARPQLEKIYRDQSLFALGQDYLSAGMLDRAERIFHELVNTNAHVAKALRALIDIYQQEKDWEQALLMAAKYEVVTKQSMQAVIAHYHCEIADSALQKQEEEEAIHHLKKALSADEACVRASLLKAKFLMQQEDYKHALPYLKKIKDQNSAYLSESIDLLAACYEKLNREDELVTYLKKLAEDYPRVPIVLILAERIREWKGDKVALTFAADYVRRYPSLRGLHLLVNLYALSVEGRAKDDLHILQNLMKKILKNKPEYQCVSCGFSGKSLHWQCPGCKKWSTVMPIHSLQEELA